MNRKFRPLEGHHVSVALRDVVDLWESATFLSSRAA